MLPSRLAAMCLAGARYKSGIEPIWTPELTTLTQYTWNDLKDDIVHKLLCIRVPSSTQLRHELDQNVITWYNNPLTAQRQYA